MVAEENMDKNAEVEEDRAVNDPARGDDARHDEWNPNDVREPGSDVFEASRRPSDYEDVDADEDVLEDDEDDEN